MPRWKKLGKEKLVNMLRYQKLQSKKKKKEKKDAAGVEETPTPMEVQEKPVKASCTYATQTEKEKEIKN